MVFVIVGEGMKKAELQKRAAAMGVDNVRFLPFQPYADLPELLASSDVLLVPLDKEKSQMSVPSKLYNFLAAGRPILGLAPADSEVAALIRGNRCGEVVPPDDVPAIGETVLKLKGDPGARREMAANARRYVVDNFARKMIMDRYEDLLAVVSRGRGPVMSRARRFFKYWLPPVALDGDLLSRREQGLGQQPHLRDLDGRVPMAVPACFRGGRGRVLCRLPQVPAFPRVRRPRLSALPGLPGDRSHGDGLRDGLSRPGSSPSLTDSWTNTSRASSRTGTGAPSIGASTSPASLAVLGTKFLRRNASRAGAARPEPCSSSGPFDIALSFVGLVLSSPLWLLFGLLIWLQDRGPVFYGQERVGKNGRVFKAMKFRSMIVDAEKGRGAVQAVANDPRVTKIGRILRATAMDELPQLWNIFKGDMSFVGPRALRPHEKEVQGDPDTRAIEDIPGYRRTACCQARADGPDPGLSARGDPATEEVPLRPSLYPEADLLAGPQARLPLVLDHVQGKMGVKDAEGLARERPDRLTFPGHIT